MLGLVCRTKAKRNQTEDEGQGQNLKEGLGERRGGTQQHFMGTGRNRTEKNKTTGEFYIAFLYPDPFLNSEAQ